MEKLKEPKNPLYPLVAAISFLVLLFTAIGMSTRPKDAAAGILVLALLFFFPGYFFLTLLRTPAGALRILLSLICGILVVTTAYSFFAETPGRFLIFVLALCGLGILAFLLHLHWPSMMNVWSREDYESIFAGVAVTLSIAPLDWRSGRFTGGDFVFYGPAAQDPLFHVTLVQRLLHHIPPDNFIVSGLPTPIYHYFDDLTLALTLTAQKVLHFGSTNLFDLYYRCYPTLIYFLVGALAYRIGRQLLGKISGGVLVILLLLGGGGLGFLSGLLQTLAHALHPVAMRSWFFSDWTGHNGVDPLLPLVQRPAYYHSLLVGSAVINLLLRNERRRRDWIAAGLMVGLLAGFNFVLAAVFGISTVFAALLLTLWRARDEAQDVVWLAVMTLVGSLPVVVTMALSGFHNQAPGFPFRGPNLEFTTAMSHGDLRRFLPAILVPIIALIIFPIRAYGVRLVGCRRMFHLDIGGKSNRAIAAVLSITFLLSFIIGIFFPYKAQGGIAVVFVQQTLWIMALFSLVPIAEWLQRNRGNWRTFALWGMLALTWIEALGAFNFGRKAAFPEGAAAVFQEIHAESMPDDVVAFLPSNLTQQPVWGRSSDWTNFSITALTGLDGYFSTESYSTAFATPGIRGKSDDEVVREAERLYQQRRDDIESFIAGDADEAVSVRLLQDHVRWIVVSGEMADDVSMPNPWRRTSDLVVYKLH